MHMVPTIISMCATQYHVRFWAHFKSSARGLHDVRYSMMYSRAVQKCNFSSGQFSQPVVMQKYVSWGATWWIRWWRLGKIMWYSCNHTTQLGSPKYVCDHLCICKSTFVKNLYDQEVEKKSNDLVCHCHKDS